jgi:hypothetical protein
MDAAFPDFLSFCKSFSAVGRNTILYFAINFQP